LSYESSNSTSLDEWLASTGRSKQQPQQTTTTNLRSSIAVGLDHTNDDLQMAIDLEEQERAKREGRPTTTAYNNGAGRAEETIIQKEIRITNENLHRCEWCKNYAVFDSTIPSHLPNLDDAAISVPFPQYEGENNAHLRVHIAVNHPHILKQGRELYHKWLEFIRARNYRLQLQKEKNIITKDEVRKSELDVQIRRLTQEMDEAMADPELSKIIFYQDKKGAEGAI
jgi:hypothetical protein